MLTKIMALSNVSIIPGVRNVRRVFKAVLKVLQEQAEAWLDEISNTV